MKHFFKRVEGKARDVRQPPVTIVAFGDSVTQGVMEHNVLDAENVYHRVLQSRLEELFPTTTFSTINAGVSGGNVPQAIERLDRDVLRRMPDLVLVAFGLNDSLAGADGIANFRDGLRFMVRTIREKTDSDVMLLTPPFMARRISYRIHPEHMPMAEQILESQNSGMLASYADSIRAVACELGISLTDIHQEWSRMASDNLDTDVWLANGLNHPDDRGHRLAASLILHRLLACREEHLLSEARHDSH